MRSFGFGGLPSLLLHRLTRFEQLALGDIQLFIGGALLDLDTGDRDPGLFVPGFLHAQLFFGGTPLNPDLLLLPGHSFRRFASGTDLQLETDDRLFLPVQFPLHGHDRGLGLRDDDVKRRNLLPKPIHLRAIDFGALAQFLDLALGGEDPPGLGA